LRAGTAIVLDSVSELVSDFDFSETRIEIYFLGLLPKTK
jgi:hypothetical protein